MTNIRVAIRAFAEMYAEKYRKTAITDGKVDEAKIARLHTEFGNAVAEMYPELSKAERDVAYEVLLEELERLPVGGRPAQPSESSHEKAVGYVTGTAVACSAVVMGVCVGTIVALGVGLAVYKLLFN